MCPNEKKKKCSLIFTRYHLFNKHLKAISLMLYFPLFSRASRGSSSLPLDYTTPGAHFTNWKIVRRSVKDWILLCWIGYMSEWIEYKQLGSDSEWVDRIQGVWIGYVSGSNPDSLDWIRYVWLWIGYECGVDRIPFMGSDTACFVSFSYPIFPPSAMAASFDVFKKINKLIYNTNLTKG